MQSHHLDSYTLGFSKWPMLVLWACLTIVFCGLYIGLVALDRRNDLASQLNVAGYTVSASLNAKDWDLALGHLQSIVEASKLYELELMNDRKTLIAGPLGTAPFGIGSSCQEHLINGSLRLRGCTRLAGDNELLALGAINIFGLLFLLVCLKILKNRARFFMGKISDELQAIRSLAHRGSSHLDVQAIGIPVEEVQVVRKKVIELLKEIESTSQAAAFGKVAALVVHDLKSPLNALDFTSSGLKDIPDAKKILIRSSIQRMRDILNHLKDRSNPEELPTCNQANNLPKAQILLSLLDSIVSEKRLYFKNRPEITIELDLQPSAYSLFCQILPSDFKRAVSNLIDNSVEAISGRGTVRIEIHRNDHNAIIRFSDTGAGIPLETLPKLGFYGATYGKAGGSGLGFYQAKTMAESNGGKISVQSTSTTGTTIDLELPLAQPPEWFLPELKISHSKTVAIIDDDPLMQVIWKNRFSKAGFNVASKQFVFFTAEPLFREWLQKRDDRDDLLCLIDYELGEFQSTGADLIRSLAIQDCAILVTGRGEDEEVQDLALQNKIKLIPKSLLEFVVI